MKAEMSRIQPTAATGNGSGENGAGQGSCFSENLRITQTDFLFTSPKYTLTRTKSPSPLMGEDWGEGA